MGEQIIRSEYLYRGRVIKLRLDQVRLPNDQLTTREIVEHRGAVAIVALDADQRVLLVRQYRSGAGHELLEIPAGTLEAGEDPAICAIRELQEETGYRALQWKELGQFYSSPGTMTEKMYLYLAHQLSSGTASPEDDELIQVESVPLTEALAMVESGEIIDAKTIIGLLRTERILKR